MRLERVRRVGLALGKREQLTRELLGRAVLRAHEPERPQSAQREHPVGGVADLLAELPRARESVLHLRRRIALGDQDDRAERVL